MELIAHLRAPDGCPWDRKQTHETLRRYLLEETYEAIEALDQGDVEALREELGDLLLQIALHAQIGAENGEFNFTHIVQVISQKIITRHPHVFGDVNVHNEQDVLQNWEKLKEIERQENGKVEKNGLLDGIPSYFQPFRRRKPYRIGRRGLVLIGWKSHRSWKRFWKSWRRLRPLRMMGNERRSWGICSSR